MATKPVLVGAFVLGALGLGVIAVLLFGGAHLFSRTVPAVIYFQGSVANLEVGAPVTFRGVRVGSVTGIAIHLDLTDFTARIPVQIALDPEQIKLRRGGADATAGLDGLLKAGLRAQLDIVSLITGQLRIDLDIDPAAAPTGPIVTSDLPEIPSIPSRLQTIEGVIANLPLKDILDNVDKAMLGLRQMTDEVGPTLAPLARSVTLTADTARATLSDLDRLSQITQQQISSDGVALHRLLTSSDQAAHDADLLLLSLQQLTAVNSPARDDLQATLRDLAASASSLRDFTRQIERNPSRLLGGGRQ